MDADRTKIRDKIAALMRKAADPGVTPEESQSFFAGAMRLMAQYNIDAAEVACSGESASSTMEFVEQTTGYLDEWRAEYQLAAAICNDYFFVRCLRTEKAGQYTMTFFGERQNVDTARFVFQSLLAAFDRLWIQQRKQKPWTPKGDRKAFIVGVARGFKDKLQMERDAMKAEAEVLGTKGEIQLASLIQKTEIEFARKYPNLGPSVGLNLGNLRDSTLAQGYQAGRDLNLAKGVGQSPAGGKALPGR